MTTPSQSVSNTPVVKVEIPSEKLLKALYFLWDAFDRTACPFFLVNDTYKKARFHKDLTGDKIEVGVRKVEWISGGGRILREFLGQPLEETETLATYEYEGVPIHINLYEDHSTVIALDTMMYRNERWNIPNPYSEFEKVYG